MFEILNSLGGRSMGRSTLYVRRIGGQVLTERRYPILVRYLGGQYLISEPSAVPETGPGPTTLSYGNSSLGFYGETSSSELFTSTDLAAAVGLTTGSSQNENEPWLKFSLDNKTLFVAKTFRRLSVSWEDLNNAGLVFGETTVTLGYYTFKVRLLTGAETQDSDLTLDGGDRQGYAPAATDVSEWNRLLYNVSSKNIGSENWEFAGYTDAELRTDSGNYIYWCQERWAADTIKKVTRGRGRVEAFLYAAGDSGVQDKLWKPVLELIMD